MNIDISNINFILDKINPDITELFLIHGVKEINFKRNSITSDTEIYVVFDKKRFNKGE